MGRHPDLTECGRRGIAIDRRDALRAGLGLSAFALAACSGPKPAETSALAGLLDDFARDILADRPELATRFGATGFARPGADQLNDRSAEAVALRRGAVLRRLVQLRGIDRARLTRSEQLSYDAVLAHLTRLQAGAGFSFGRFSHLGGFSPYVLNHLDCAAVTLPDFFAADVPITTMAEGDSYVARLARVADAIDAETARARVDMAAGIIPSAGILERTAAALSALVAAPPERSQYLTGLRARLEMLVGRIEPGRTAPGQANAVELLNDAVKLVSGNIAAAHRRALTAVAEMHTRAGAEPSLRSRPEAAAFYSAALAYETTTRLTPQEVHETGLQRVKELQAQLDVALRAQGSMQGEVGARLAALAADPRFSYPDTVEGRDQVLADLRAAQTRIESRMSGWFADRTRAPLAFAAVRADAPLGQPAAFYHPPRPAAKRPGLVLVDLRDLAALPRFDVTSLVAHEGMPGHHLQMSTTQETPSLPLLRRLMAFAGFIEGWGVYAEQLADEMGVYDGDPFGRIGYLRWRLWRAARCVVDTGLHALNWTRDQAIAYLVQTTGDTPNGAADEVDRYFVWPGQAAAYELGALRMTELREKARAEMGARFDIKAFHGLVLTSGAIPLDVLETAVNDWITPAPERSPA
jgi:uncharacterized protein (DUF885 family)